MITQILMITKTSKYHDGYIQMVTQISSGLIDLNVPRGVQIYTMKMSLMSQRHQVPQTQG